MKVPVHNQLSLANTPSLLLFGGSREQFWTNLTSEKWPWVSLYCRRACPFAPSSTGSALRFDFFPCRVIPQLFLKIAQDGGRR